MKNCSVFKFDSLVLLINLPILVFSVSEYIYIIVNIGKRFDRYPAFNLHKNLS